MGRHLGPTEYTTSPPSFLLFHVSPLYQGGVVLKDFLNFILLFSGRHEEALQDFFCCLMLEQGLARPVKQELAKELLQLLRSSARKTIETKDLDTDSLASQNSLSDNSNSSSSASLNEVIDILKPSDLPEQLIDMANYLENLAEDSTSSALEDKNLKSWLTVQDQVFDKPFR